MMVSYGCVYKRSSNPVIKGSRVESIEDSRKEYKQLLEEGWRKTSIFKVIFSICVCRCLVSVSFSLLHFQILLANEKF